MQKDKLRMKHLSCFFYAILAICLVACGGNKQTSNDSEVSEEISDIIVEQTDSALSDDMDVENDDIDSSELSESEISTDNDENADLAETSNSEESTSLPSGSEELQELLNEYKSNVSKYISLAKKAAKGDLKALSEYKTLYKETKKIRSQLSDAKSQLSAAQLEQFNEISKKLLDMASESE